jgi:excisionase family DNA binding protein
LADKYTAAMLPLVSPCCEGNEVTRAYSGVDQLWDPIEIRFLWQNLASIAFSWRGTDFMQDEILTLPEVAQLLKVAEKTVYTMAQRRELPAFKVGGQWRFKREDIDQWIERQKSLARDAEALK